MDDVLDEMILTRRAPGARTSWNAETRTVECVVSTFKDVSRYSFIERLSRDAADWDLARVDAPGGMPFLVAHDAHSPTSKVGRVLSVTIGARDVRAKVQLSRSDEADALVRDLEDGIGVAISFGYRVGRWEMVEGGEDTTPVRVARKIEVLEVSAVSIPADAGAFVRSTTVSKVAAAAEIEDDDDDQEVRIFGPKEKKRLVERTGLSDAFYRQHARKDELAFRRAVLGAIADEADRTSPGPPSSGTRGSNDDPEIRIRAMGEALHARVAPVKELSEPAREYAGLTIPEMARRCLHDRGERTTGMAQAQLITRALHTTSDFPLMLEDGIRRTVRAAYEAAPSPLKQVARKTTARDFRAKHSLTLSSGPGLERVNEHGEFKSGTFRESDTSYRIETFGKIFGITRQALINDDLGVFEQLPAKFGQMASAFEADFLVKLLLSNPKMSDNVVLFHADHANLGAALALSVAALGVARLALRRQTGLAGDLISVTPKYLIVGPELETVAEQVLGAIAAAQTSDVNPFSGKLTLVVEPRISGLGWYVVAATGEVDGLEYAYLEGVEGPEYFTEAGFNIDGIKTKVRLDFGAGFVDWRGWYRNPGAAQP